MAILTLSRKLGESIMIGDSIKIIVIEVRGDKVRLSFDAPKDIPIQRKEIYDAIKKEEATQLHQS